MTQPEKVLIPHDDYDFETVGRFPDGRQFMAFVTGAFPLDNPYGGKNWLDVKRWIAVIHIFDPDGNHLETEARLIGFAREEPHLGTKMDTMFAELLSDYEVASSMYCDIRIRPFHTVVNEIKYEFVYERVTVGDEFYEQMALWPNNVVFYPPWNDGRYET